VKRIDKEGSAYIKFDESAAELKVPKSKFGNLAVEEVLPQPTPAAVEFPTRKGKMKLLVGKSQSWKVNDEPWTRTAAPAGKVQRPKPSRLAKQAVESALSHVSPAMNAVFTKHPEMRSELQDVFLQRLAAAPNKAEGSRLALQTKGMVQALDKHWQEDPLSLRIYIAQSASLQKAREMQSAIENGHISQAKVDKMLTEQQEAEEKEQQGPDATELQRVRETAAASGEDLPPEYQPTQKPSFTQPVLALMPSDLPARPVQSQVRAAAFARFL